MPTLTEARSTRRRSTALGLALAVSLRFTPALADAPAWVAGADTAKAGAYDAATPAVVLLDEENVTVDKKGRVTTSARYAVRILTAEGKDAAEVAVHYRPGSLKVRDLEAWLVRPSGDVERIGEKDARDIPASSDDVFNEVRMKLIVPGHDAEAGSVFACEWTTEEEPLFPQREWQFQSRFPVLVSRFSLSLPEGWQARAITFNHPAVSSELRGTTTTWELRGLGYLPDEPLSPPVTDISPRLALNYSAPVGADTELARPFSDWAAVSRWMSDLGDPQAVVSEAISSRARELVAGSVTPLDRLRAIGRFVQGIHYISIQTGIGRGGGYRPHSSVEVLAKSYGDCKDKANLMRALLKSLGIPAYLTSIYAGDRDYVREEWPSPQQFNHCIIAIQTGDTAASAPIVTHARLGRLLLFDPTDDQTPLGDLPAYEQGSLALVAAGDSGTLIRVPVALPGANRLERVVEATLFANGSITARVVERSTGQNATRERRLYHGSSTEQYPQIIERWVGGPAAGARVTNVSARDSSTQGRFNLSLDVEAPHYAQLIRDRLLVFKPALLSRRGEVPVSAPTRRHPVVLEGDAESESATFVLPSGFAVDELPSPVRLETEFGSYECACRAVNDSLRCSRSLVTRTATLPRDQYARVRDFYQKIRAAENADVVLVRR